LFTLADECMCTFDNPPRKQWKVHQSPCRNRGLNFDSNIQKLPNRYWYVDETEGGRAIRVHCAAIIEALKKLYGAGALVIGQPNSRWCVADPLPPSAALPLTRRGRINLSCCRRNLPLVR